MINAIQILLVDDSPYFVNAARDYLLMQPIVARVETAFNGEEALQKAQDKEFDVILLDLNLPGKSGLQLIPEFREKFPVTKIIIVSNLDENSYGAASIKAGADAFVHKSDMIKTLLATIQKFIGQDSASPQPKNAPALKKILSLSTLVENARDLVYRFDFLPEPRFTYVSPSATQITGYTPEDHYADAQLGFKIVHPDDTGLLQAINQVNIYLEQPVVLRWVRKDGQVIWMEQNNVPVHDEHGRLIAIEGIARDITQAKLTEQALIESEARLASVIDSAMDAVIILDDQHKIVLFNPAAEKMFLCLEEDAIGKTLDRFIPERYRSSHREHLKHFQLTNETLRSFQQQMEMLALRSNGEEFPIEATISTSLAAQKQYFTVILRDIQQRIQVEKALRDSEKHYRNIFNGVQDAIFVESFDGRILAVNDRACEMYGYTQDEFLTKTVADLVPPGHPIVMGNKSEISLAPIETMNLRANGEAFPIEISGRVQTINGNHEEVLLIIVRDISSRIIAEQARIDSETSLRKAQHVAHVGSWTWYIQENRLEWSDEMFNIFGIEQEGFSGNLFEVIAKSIHPEDRDKVENSNHEVIEHHHPVPLEYRIVRSDGSVRTVWAEAGELILDRFGKATKLSGIVQDISEYKQAEKRLENSRQFFQDMLDALSAHIAILDENGSILSVNASWRKFGEKNGLMLENSGIGSNYLTICRAASGEDARLSNAIADIIEALLKNNDQEEIKYFEYPCHGPYKARWFNARITKFIENGRPRLVISHENITLRKMAEEKIRQQVEQLLALREIDLTIASTSDLNQSLDILLQNTLRLLHVDAAAILQVKPDDQTLHYIAGHGFRTAKIKQAHVKFSESYAGLAATEQRVVRIQDFSSAEPNPIFSDFLSEEHFVSYYGAPLINKGKVIGVLEVFSRSEFEQDDGWLDFFTTLAGQAAIAIENAQLFSELKNINTELLLAYDATIEGWSRAMDLRDKETEGHTRRVTDLTIRLAQLAGICDDQIVHIRRGCLLHDIGKMGVPDQVLNKPGKLSDEEWVIMKKHPTFAYEMLSAIAFLNPAVDIPYCHHEKWDGSGYPRGLQGEQIPFAARLFAIVDVFDALTNDRPYRSAWTADQALAYVIQNSGSHFDPQVVELFVKLMAEE